MKYDKTPSFYKDQASFEKYLQNTSFYINMQKTVVNLVRLLPHTNVLELGAATGETTRYVGRACPDGNICGLDNRDDIIGVAKNQTTDKNVSYIVQDMEIISENVSKFDVIYSLYSFHHINDPVDNKYRWLVNLFNKMKKGSYFIVGDLFLPEDDSIDLNVLWKKFAAEAYRSVYYNMLNVVNDLSPRNLDFISFMAKHSMENEIEVGRLAIERKDEFLIKKSWLIDNAKAIGFSLIMDIEINDINDSIVVFKK